MAEGGDPNKSEINPFSFHNFVKNSKTEQENEESSSKRSTGVASADSDRVSEDEQRRSNLLDDDAGAGVGATASGIKREENPFSFRQFLKKDSHHKSKGKHQQSDPLAATQPHHHHHHHHHSPHHERKSEERGCGATLLPDFVTSSQGHSVAAAAAATPPADSGTTDYNSSAANASRTTYAWSDAVAREDNEAMDASVRPRHSGRNTVGTGTAAQQEGAVSGGSLPDFLSHGPTLSQLVATERPTSAADYHHHHQQQQQQHTGSWPGERSQLGPHLDLREENARLSRKLEKTRALLSAETRKVVDLEKQVASFRQKEADETKALEHIVQDVENNLQGAAKRALLAESSIVKLNQEIKTLQSQLSKVCWENERLRAASARAEEVRRKASTAADHISTAANVAEHQLKQLLSGVSSLKIVGACLANIDKMSESDVDAPPDSTSEET